MPVPTRGPLAVANRYRAFRQNAVLIVVEGNIGAGKTTLLTILKDHFHVIQREFPNNNLELETLTEPIGEWVDGNGNKLLEVQNHFISKKKLVSTLCSVFMRIHASMPTPFRPASNFPISNVWSTLLLMLPLPIVSVAR